MTLNSCVVVHGVTVKLRSCLRFRVCERGVSSGKPSARKDIWIVYADTGLCNLASYKMHVYGSHFEFVLRFERCNNVRVTLPLNKY